MAIDICICGITGRMGTAVTEEILKSYSAKLNIKSGIAKEAGTDYKGVRVYGLEPIALKEVNGIIDFSSPAALLKLVELAAATKNVQFIVSGTTGLNEEQVKQIEETVGKSSLSMILSPNFSPLVNTQIMLCEKAAAVLTKFGYDFGLLDEHHTLKKDAPSGTAKKILAKVSKATGISKINYWHEENRLKEKGTIDVAVLRTGGTPGIHEFRIVGEHGRLTIDSLMYNRSDFAKGAVESLLWLSLHGKEGKLHSFEEVMEL